MDKNPVFSIIIPTYNRPKQLAICLESFTNLDYPSDRFEVIVVDDGSLKSLDTMVTSFQEKLMLQLIRQDNAGPASARNLGAYRAKGKFLMFIDDDCRAHSNCLNALSTHFDKAPNALLGGHTINELLDNIYSEASQLLLNYLYIYYNTESNPAHFFASNNIALAKDRFHQIGGFDISFPLAAAEDREFCDRWLHKGNKMIYAPEIIVYHAHKLTLSTFCRQHFNYGRGAFCFHKTRIKRTNGRIKIEPITFYLNLLLYPLRQKSSPVGILVSILFLISQLANVCGFFWEKWHLSAKEIK